jgi:hypothetical protein
MEKVLKTESHQKLNLGFLIQFEAKEDRAEEIARAMFKTLPNIEDETGTIVWFGFRTSKTGFGVFDAFYNEDARNVHWELGSKRLEKLSPFINQESFSVKKVDIIQSKCHGK